MGRVKVKIIVKVVGEDVWWLLHITPEARLEDLALANMYLDVVKQKLLEEEAKTKAKLKIGNEK